MVSTNPNKCRKKELVYKNDLKSFENVIYTIARMEYSRLNGSYLMDFKELIAIGTVVVNDLLKDEKSQYNKSYMSTAIKWAIRNELRRRYKWYSSKDDQSQKDDDSESNPVYTSVLSINELSEQENPVQIEDKSITPDRECESNDLNCIIQKSIKKLPPRERSIIESRFYNDKKIKDIAEEFQISPSRISRIIQSGLGRIKKDLKKQEVEAF